MEEYEEDNKDGGDNDNTKMNLIKQNLQGMDILSYYLDDYGYLMDDANNYILDEKGDLIQLNDK